MVADPSDAEEDVLLANEDGKIARIGNLVVCTCEASDFDLPLRGLVIFAFVVSTIVTILSALGIAPRLLLAVTVVWFGGAAYGLSLLRRRAREIGRFEIDPQRRELRQLQGSRLARRLPLTEVAGYAIARDIISVGADPRYDVAPRWIVLRLPKGRIARLGRGRPWELAPALRALEEAGVPRAETPSTGSAKGSGLF